MKAIILAAGRGSRMGNLTASQPKCFVKFHGKRLIDWQIEALTQAGICEIAIVRGYMAQSFNLPCTYFDNLRWNQTNMVSSLMVSGAMLAEGPCIISYSDIVYSSKSIEKLKMGSADISITYDPNWLSLWQLRFEDPLSDAETFKLDNSGHISEIGHKAGQIQDIQGQYMGLSKVTPRGWHIIKNYLDGMQMENVEQMDMTMLLSGLIDSGIKIKGISIDENWFEVDSETDLIHYNAIPVNQLFKAPLGLSSK